MNTRHHNRIKQYNYLSGYIYNVISTSKFKISTVTYNIKIFLSIIIGWQLIVPYHEVLKQLFMGIVIIIGYYGI